jgi:NAD(P)H-dependent FMN reductase
MRALHTALVLFLLAAPGGVHAAACHDEADRLSARHKLDAADAPQPPHVAPVRERAKDHLDKARRADDDGIVEECLRQLAQARTLVEDSAPH